MVGLACTAQWSSSTRMPRCMPPRPSESDTGRGTDRDGHARETVTPLARIRTMTHKTN